LFCLGVLVKPDLFQRFQYLRAAVVDSMGHPYEGDDDIPICCFIEDYLRMARGDELRALLIRGLGQELVDLALAQNLEMRIRLIEEQDGVRIGVEVRQEQERLLQPMPRRR